MMRFRGILSDPRAARARARTGHPTRMPRPAGFARAGFTLIELMVSIGVLLILLTMVAWIFKTATGASRTATAANEMNGSLRAAEQQLGKDFGGLLRDNYMAIWYQLTEVADPENPGQTKWIRTDRITFFTSGDHSSTNQLIDPAHGSVSAVTVPPAPWNKTREMYYQSIRSTVARVFLGHHNIGSADADPRSLILARRARMLSPELGSLTNYDDAFEFDGETVQSWKEKLAGGTLASLFDSRKLMEEDQSVIEGWFRRPTVDPKIPDPTRVGKNGLHMLFLSGCAEFKVQRWIERWPGDGTALGPYSTHGMPRWWPEEDIDGNGKPDEANTNASMPDKSDFRDNSTGSDNQNVREYFNGPLAPSTGAVRFYPASGSNAPWFCYSAQDVPKAIKITLRLYDPNGRIADGQVFTMTYTLR